MGELRDPFTVAPRYNEPRYNEDPVNYNEQQLKAQQNYSKKCGNKPRYNELILRVAQLTPL